MEAKKHKHFNENKMPDDAPVEFSFDILKNINDDGNMSLPQHTGNTETKIDTLPGYNDLDEWFIKRYNAATYGLLQMRMMKLNRTNDDFRQLEDWVIENEQKYLDLTIK